jgi:hypothetical protein
MNKENVALSTGNSATTPSVAPQSKTVTHMGTIRSVSDTLKQKQTVGSTIRLYTQAKTSITLITVSTVADTVDENGTYNSTSKTATVRLHSSHYSQVAQLSVNAELEIDYDDGCPIATSTNATLFRYGQTSVPLTIVQL